MMNFIRTGNTAESLGLGGAPKEYVDEKMSQAILDIIKVNPNLIFGGSFGLVYEGKLKRKVKDLDIICLDLKKHKNTSSIFKDLDFRISIIPHSMVLEENKERESVEALSFEGIKIDLFDGKEYLEEKSIYKYKEMKFKGHPIRIGDPWAAIDAKIRYMRKTQNKFIYEKHLKDLLEMRIPYEKIKEVFLKENKSLYWRIKEILKNKKLSWQ